MASTKKHCWKLMLSEGWKCYFRDPVFQNLPGKHASGPPLAVRAFGERDWPHQINLTLLRHWWVGDIARWLLVLSATINIWGGAQSIKGFATLKNVVNLQFISEVRPDISKSVLNKSRLHKLYAFKEKNWGTEMCIKFWSEIGPNFDHFGLKQSMVFAL